MSRELNRWWHVPGPEARLTDWIVDLENSRSLVFLMPQGNSLPNPLFALERAPRLTRTLFDFIEIEDDPRDPMSPGELLATHVGDAKERAPRHGAGWVGNEELEKCLVVHAPTGDDATKAWIRFVEEFAEAVRNSAHKQDCARFALLVRADLFDDEYVSNTPNVGVVRIGVATTRLDLMCHASRAMEPTNDPRELELRVGLCSELCAGDLDALDELVTLDLDTLCDVDKMIAWWLGREQVTTGPPTDTPWKQWADGHVRHIDGRSHAAPCSCDEDVLRRWVPRAVWAAQARTLIPVLDGIRRRAIERFGARVKLPHERESGYLIDQVDALEIGDLAFLASQGSLGHVKTSERQELYAMQHARNDLCHNTHLPATKVEQVLTYGRNL